MSDADLGRANTLYESGADLAGALSGAAIGLIGGPAGAFGGAALGVAVTRVGRTISRRHSDREQERMGATLLLVLEESSKKDTRGEHLREDGFFEATDGLRADADEILEAVLREAAKTYEERKLPYLAKLYARIAYDENIDTATAFFLVRMAESFTYRQYIILALVDWTEREAGALPGDPSSDFRLLDTWENRLRADTILQLEHAALAEMALLEKPPGARRHQLSDTGQLLVRSMSLVTLPRGDIRALIRADQDEPRVESMVDARHTTSTERSEHAEMQPDVGSPTHPWTTVADVMSRQSSQPYSFRPRKQA